MKARTYKHRFYSRWSVSHGAFWAHRHNRTIAYGIGGVGGWPVRLPTNIKCTR